MTYSEKLKDPRWQKRRLAILDRDNFSCCACSDSKTTLHVHHKEYIRGNEPWEYEDSNFQTLCKVCHIVAEHFKKDGGEIIICDKIKSIDNDSHCILNLGVYFGNDAFLFYELEVIDQEVIIHHVLDKWLAKYSLSVINRAESKMLTKAENITING